MRDLLIILVIAIAMLGLGSASNTQPKGVGNDRNVELSGFKVTPGAYGELGLTPSEPTIKGGTGKVSIENPQSKAEGESYFGLKTYPKGEAHSTTQMELYYKMDNQFVSDQSNKYLTSIIEIDGYPAVRTDFFGPNGNKIVSTMVVVILSPTEELRMVLRDPDLIYNVEHTKINGYDEEGYDKNGYDKNGYDKNGYDKNGYDKNGYDEQGVDKNGYDELGLDENFDPRPIDQTSAQSDNGIGVSIFTQNPVAEGVLKY